MIGQTDFRRDVLRKCVAQICVQMGWSGIMPSALNSLVHILEMYLMQLVCSARLYADQFEHTELTLNDLCLSFLKYNIKFDELREYMACTEPSSAARDVPHFPAPRNCLHAKLTSPSKLDGANQTHCGNFDEVNVDKKQLYDGNVIVKKLRELPDEASASQYEMKSMSKLALECGDFKPSMPGRAAGFHLDINKSIDYYDTCIIKKQYLPLSENHVSLKKNIFDSCDVEEVVGVNKNFVSVTGDENDILYNNYDQQHHSATVPSLYAKDIKKSFFKKLKHTQDLIPSTPFFPHATPQTLQPPSNSSSSASNASKKPKKPTTKEAFIAKKRQKKLVSHVIKTPRIDDVEYIAPKEPKKRGPKPKIKKDLKEVIPESHDVNVTNQAVAENTPTTSMSTIKSKVPPPADSNTELTAQELTLCKKNSIKPKQKKGDMVDVIMKHSSEGSSTYEPPAACTVPRCVTPPAPIHPSPTTAVNCPDDVDAEEEVLPWSDDEDNINNNNDSDKNINLININNNNSFFNDDHVSDDSQARDVHKVTGLELILGRNNLSNQRNIDDDDNDVDDHVDVSSPTNQIFQPSPPPLIKAVKTSKKSYESVDNNKHSKPSGNVDSSNYYNSIGPLMHNIIDTDVGINKPSEKVHKKEKKKKHKKNKHNTSFDTKNSNIINNRTIHIFKNTNDSVTNKSNPSYNLNITDTNTCHNLQNSITPSTSYYVDNKNDITNNDHLTPLHKKHQKNLSKLSLNASKHRMEAHRGRPSKPDPKLVALLSAAMVSSDDYQQTDQARSPSRKVHEGKKKKKDSKRRHDDVHVGHVDEPSKSKIFRKDTTDQPAIPKLTLKFGGATIGGSSTVGGCSTGAVRSGAESECSNNEFVRTLPSLQCTEPLKIIIKSFNNSPSLPKPYTNSPAMQQRPSRSPAPPPVQRMFTPSPVTESRSPSPNDLSRLATGKKSSKFDVYDSDVEVTSPVVPHQRNSTSCERNFISNIAEGHHSSSNVRNSPIYSDSPSPPPRPPPPPPPHPAAPVVVPLVSKGSSKDNKHGASKKAGRSSVKVNLTPAVGKITKPNGDIVWICPTCGFPDNGTPMIGCDRCDDWYHWVCVNITKEPPAEMNWYCVRCLAHDPTLHNQTKNLSVPLPEVPPPLPTSAGRRGRPSGKGKSKKH